VWFAFSGAASVLEPREDLAALEPTTGARPAQREARAESAALAAPSTAVQESAKPSAPAPAVTGPLTLDGQVTDRFGWPLPGERVWLVPGDERHPQSGDDLQRLVTATTSSKGKFSLTLPNQGPWRLAVGPPGGARTTLPEARELDGTQRAQVVLSGGTELRVSFDGLPPGDDLLTLELIALAEPGAGGRRERRGDRGSSDDKGKQGGGTGAGKRAKRDKGDKGDKAGENRNSRDSGQREGEPGAAAATRESSPVVSLAALAPAAQDGGARRQGRRRNGETGNEEGNQDNERRDGRDRSRKRDREEQQDGPPEPPPEVWRHAHAHEFSSEERAAREVRIGGLAVDRVSRLALKVGDVRLEGLPRFSLSPDTVTQLRVFQVSSGPGSVLNYVVSTRALARDESPAGVSWVEQ